MPKEMYRITTHSVNEVADKLQVCRETVLRHIRAKRIKAQLIGKNYAIPESSVIAFINGEV